MHLQSGPDCSAVAFSPNGTSFATGGGDRIIRIWDTATGKATTQLSGAERAVNALAFSQNDEFLLAASNDNSTKIWSLQTHRIQHTLTGHLGKVVAATFTHDSQRVRLSSLFDSPVLML